MSKNKLIDIRNFLKDLHEHKPREDGEDATVIPLKPRIPLREEPPQPKLTTNMIRKVISDVQASTKELQDNIVEVVHMVDNLELEIFKTNAFLLTLKEALISSGVLSEDSLTESWNQHIKEPEQASLKKHRNNQLTKVGDK